MIIIEKQEFSRPAKYKNTQEDNLAWLALG
jgi:hypothetical protein